MPNYKRNFLSGGTFFFTVVTHGRRPWLCTEKARISLRMAIQEVRAKRPFAVDAWVLMPDHMHCLWELPQDDHDFSIRWRLIKASVSRKCAETFEETDIDVGNVGCVSDSVTHRNASRLKRRESDLWQRRFWEHTIRDERDYAAHCDYIHYNPVKHGLCKSPGDWPYSTFHRFVTQGGYDIGWGAGVEPKIAEGTGKE
ncbi:MAG: REP-associated tyrosine transposase [Syntrophales bacterium]